MSDLVLAKCRGCMREFGIEGNADMRQFVQHCLRGCDAYQLQAIAAQCDVCRRYCMDDAALVKHRTSPDSRCPLPDSSHTKSDVVPLSPVAGPSRCTTIEVVSDPVVRGKAGNEPTDVITISDNRPATPRLDGVCYEYVPDATTGDVVVWSGTSETIEATVCKGCQQVFPTLQTR